MKKNIARVMSSVLCASLISAQGALPISAITVNNIRGSGNVTVDNVDLNVTGSVEIDGNLSLLESKVSINDGAVIGGSATLRDLHDFALQNGLVVSDDLTLEGVNGVVRGAGLESDAEIDINDSTLEFDTDSDLDINGKISVTLTNSDMRLSTSNGTNQRISGNSNVDFAKLSLKNAYKEGVRKSSSSAIVYWNYDYGLNAYYAIDDELTPCSEYDEHPVATSLKSATSTERSDIDATSTTFDSELNGYAFVNSEVETIYALYDNHLFVMKYDYENGGYDTRIVNPKCDEITVDSTGREGGKITESDGYFDVLNHNAVTLTTKGYPTIDSNNLTYTWYCGDTPVSDIANCDDYYSGYNSEVLTIKDFNPQLAGMYSCVVTERPDDQLSVQSHVCTNKVSLRAKPRALHVYRTDKADRDNDIENHYEADDVIDFYAKDSGINLKSYFKSGSIINDTTRLDSDTMTGSTYYPAGDIDIKVCNSIVGAKYDSSTGVLTFDTYTLKKKSSNLTRYNCILIDVKATSDNSAWVSNNESTVRYKVVVHPNPIIKVSNSKKDFEDGKTDIYVEPELTYNGESQQPEVCRNEFFEVVSYDYYDKNKNKLDAPPIVPGEYTYKAVLKDGNCLVGGQEIEANFKIIPKELIVSNKVYTSLDTFNGISEGDEVKVFGPDLNNKDNKIAMGVIEKDADAVSLEYNTLCYSGKIGDNLFKAVFDDNKPIKISGAAVNNYSIKTVDFIEGFVGPKEDADFVGTPDEIKDIMANIGMDVNITDDGETKNERTDYVLKIEEPGYHFLVDGEKVQEIDLRDYKEGSFKFDSDGNIYMENVSFKVVGPDNYIKPITIQEIKVPVQKKDTTTGKVEDISGIIPNDVITKEPEKEVVGSNVSIAIGSETLTPAGNLTIVDDKLYIDGELVMTDVEVTEGETGITCSGVIQTGDKKGTTVENVTLNNVEVVVTPEKEEVKGSNVSLVVDSKPITDTGKVTIVEDKIYIDDVLVMTDAEVSKTEDGNITCSGTVQVGEDAGKHVANVIIDNAEVVTTPPKKEFVGSNVVLTTESEKITESGEVTIVDDKVFIDGKLVMTDTVIKTEEGKVICSGTMQVGDHKGETMKDLVLDNAVIKTNETEKEIAGSNVSIAPMEKITETGSVEVIDDKIYINGELVMSDVITSVQDGKVTCSGKIEVGENKGQRVDDVVINNVDVVTTPSKDVVSGSSVSISIADQVITDAGEVKVVDNKIYIDDKLVMSDVTISSKGDSIVCSGTIEVGDNKGERVENAVINDAEVIKIPAKTEIKGSNADLSVKGPDLVSPGKVTVVNDKIFIDGTLVMTDVKIDTSNNGEIKCSGVMQTGDKKGETIKDVIITNAEIVDKTTPKQEIVGSDIDIVVGGEKVVEPGEITIVDNDLFIDGELVMTDVVISKDGEDVICSGVMQTGEHKGEHVDNVIIENVTANVVESKEEVSGDNVNVTINGEAITNSGVVKVVDDKLYIDDTLVMTDVVVKENNDTVVCEGVVQVGEHKGESVTNAVIDNATIVKTPPTVEVSGSKANVVVGAEKVNTSGNVIIVEDKVYVDNELVMTDAVIKTDETGRVVCSGTMQVGSHAGEKVDNITLSGATVIDNTQPKEEVVGSNVTVVVDGETLTEPGKIIVVGDNVYIGNELVMTDAVIKTEDGKVSCSGVLQVGDHKGEYTEDVVIDNVYVKTDTPTEEVVGSNVEIKIDGENIVEPGKIIIVDNNVYIDNELVMTDAAVSNNGGKLTCSGIIQVGEHKGDRVDNVAIDNANVVEKEKKEEIVGSNVSIKIEDTIIADSGKVTVVDDKIFIDGQLIMSDAKVSKTEDGITCSGTIMVGDHKGEHIENATIDNAIVINEEVPYKIDTEKPFIVEGPLRVVVPETGELVTQVDVVGIQKKEDCQYDKKGNLVINNMKVTIANTETGEVSFIEYPKVTVPVKEVDVEKALNTIAASQPAISQVEGTESIITSSDTVLKVEEPTYILVNGELKTEVNMRDLVTDGSYDVNGNLDTGDIEIIYVTNNVPNKVHLDSITIQSVDLDKDTPPEMEKILNNNSLVIRGEEGEKFIDPYGNIVDSLDVREFPAYNPITGAVENFNVIKIAADGTVTRERFDKFEVEPVETDTDNTDITVDTGIVAEPDVQYIDETGKLVDSIDLTTHPNFDAETGVVTDVWVKYIDNEGNAFKKHYDKVIIKDKVPTATVKPTATPTVKPTATPTVKPTATTTATVKPTDTPMVTSIPTVKPTTTPIITVKPVVTSTAIVKPVYSYGSGSSGGGGATGGGGGATVSDISSDLHSTLNNRTQAIKSDTLSNAIIGCVPNKESTVVNNVEIVSLTGELKLKEGTFVDDNGKRISTINLLSDKAELDESGNIIVKDVDVNIMNSNGSIVSYKINKITIPSSEPEMKLKVASISRGHYNAEGVKCYSNNVNADAQIVSGLRGLKGVEYTLNGNKVSQDKLKFKKEGKYDLDVTAKDNFGREYTKSYRFIVDRTKPKFSKKNNSTFSPSDNLSGLKSLRVNSARRKTKQINLKPGKYFVTVEDYSGNKLSKVVKVK